MKFKAWTGITAMIVIAALANCVRLAAQGEATNFRHYKLVDLGTFGGPSSYLAGSNGVNDAVNRVLNNRGTVVGWGDTSTLDPFAPNCFEPIPKWGLLPRSRVSVGKRCSDRPASSS